MVLHSSSSSGDRLPLARSFDEPSQLNSSAGILSLRDRGDAINYVNFRKSPEALGFRSDADLLHGVFGGATTELRQLDMFVRADMPAPAEAKDDNSKRLQQLAKTDPAAYAKEVHSTFAKLTTDLTSDINKSNEAMQVPRALAESILRLGTGFMWGGTGISQHANWQKDIPARRNVSTGIPIDEKGTIKLEPKDWQACLEEVQNHRDQLNRKWGNCGEQAACMCALLYDRIKNDPAYKGLQVRQAYSPKGHSWAELKYPDGTVKIYDPWGAQSGRRQDLTALRDYYDDEKTCHTPWFGDK